MLRFISSQGRKIQMIGQDLIEQDNLTCLSVIIYEGGPARFQPYFWYGGGGHWSYGLPASWVVWGITQPFHRSYETGFTFLHSFIMLFKDIFHDCSLVEQCIKWQIYTMLGVHSTTPVASIFNWELRGMEMWDNCDMENVNKHWCGTIPFISLRGALPQFCQY